MGLGDIFKASENQKLQDENNNLKQEIERYKTILTPEVQNAIKRVNYNEELKQQKINLESEINQLNKQIENLNSEIQGKRDEIINLDEEITMQSCSLYKPAYNFTKSTEYMQKIEEIRLKQKNLINSDNAVTAFAPSSVRINNSFDGSVKVKSIQVIQVLY